MPSRHSLAIFSAACFAAFAPLAQADPATAAPVAEAVVPVPTEAAAPAARPQSPFGDAQAVDGSALQAVTGMANLQQFANATNSSVVAGNSVNGQSVTGQIAIDGQSFQNMNGLSILTANTGNNVSINAAMNVNVSISQ